MTATEEQLEAHLAKMLADEEAERAKREAFVRSLAEAYDGAVAAHNAAKGVEPCYVPAEAHRAGLLAAAERAMRAHAADLLRIECDLNGALNDKCPGPHKHTFAACHAVGEMRRLRARMVGKRRRGLRAGAGRP